MLRLSPVREFLPPPQGRFSPPSLQLHRWWLMGLSARRLGRGLTPTATTSTAGQAADRSATW